MEANLSAILVPLMSSLIESQASPSMVSISARSAVRCIAWLDGFGDDGRQHGRYELLVRVMDSAHLAGAKREPLSSSQDRSDSQESHSAGGCEQANFEFDGENLAIVRSESHGRVSARAIGNTADHTRMNIAVLLRESGREWHGNVDATWLYELKRHPERIHESLSRETASNFVRSSQSALPSNEKEISHGRVAWQGSSGAF
jgi:hypothetical protein